jgi:hypothetical protein
MTMKRTALVLTLAAIAAAMLVLSPGIAGADPVNSNNAEIFEISCSNGQTYEIVVAGGIPGHIVDSTGNIIPTEVTFAIIDPETGQVIDSETFSIGQGNKQGLQGDLITCETEPLTEVDPETGEEVTFVLTVEAFLTPLGP